MQKNLKFKKNMSVIEKCLNLIKSLADAYRVVTQSIVHTSERVHVAAMLLEQLDAVLCLLEEDAGQHGSRLDDSDQSDSDMEDQEEKSVQS